MLRFRGILLLISHAWLLLDVFRPYFCITVLRPSLIHYSHYSNSFILRADLSLLAPATSAIGGLARLPERLLSTTPAVSTTNTATGASVGEESTKRIGVKRGWTEVFSVPLSSSRAHIAQEIIGEGSLGVGASIGAEGCGGAHKHKHARLDAPVLCSLEVPLLIETPVQDLRVCGGACLHTVREHRSICVLRLCVFVQDLSSSLRTCVKLFGACGSLSDRLRLFSYPLLCPIFRKISQERLIEPCILTILSVLFLPHSRT